MFGSEQWLTPDRVPSEWDFYPQINAPDRTSTVLVNLWFNSQCPLDGAGVHACLELAIVPPGPHGIGTPEAAAQLVAVEGKLRSAAAEAGVFFVARQRGRGRWKLHFYLAAAAVAAFEQAVGARVAGLAAADQPLRVSPDPDWSIYREQLYPSPERWQWIVNRRAMDSLKGTGHIGQHATIVHVFGLSRQEDELGLAKVALAADLTPCAVPPLAEPDHPFAAAYQETTLLELETVHRAVTHCTTLASLAGVVYEGWRLAEGAALAPALA